MVEEEVGDDSKTRLLLRVDQPVVGVKVVAFNYLRKKGDGKTKAVIPSDNHHNRTKRFKWYRSRVKHTCASDDCINGPIKDSPAKIQNVFTSKRYCTPTCFEHGWEEDVPVKRTVDDEGHPLTFIFDDADEWLMIGDEKSYIPTEADVGHVLRVDCSILSTKRDVIANESIITKVVVSIPRVPLARQLHPNRNASVKSEECGLRVVSYNILAEMYATHQLYPSCPMWCLQWNVRRMVLLEEILSYNADVICLQEVQERVFKEYFSVEFGKHGYSGVYKGKTRALNVSEGCCVFLRDNRFRVIEQHDIEFNTFALSLAESGVFDQDTIDSLLKRVLRDNIAQLLLIETTTPQHGHNDLFCVANTHIFWDPEYSDVKLWQTQLLVQELERFLTIQGHNYGVGTKLPLVVCGDFNSEPDTPVVNFLKGEHITIDFDPCGILRVMMPVRNTLNIDNAYSILNAEPQYTNYTDNYKGVLDYIFISTQSIKVTSCLLVPSEYRLRGIRDTTIPNMSFPSDHIALCIDIVIHF